jgi:hypothetical protein
VATITAKRLPTEEELAEATESLLEAVEVVNTWTVRDLVEKVARQTPPGCAPNDDQDEVEGPLVVPSFEDLGRLYAWVYDSRSIIEQISYDVEKVAGRLDDLISLRVGEEQGEGRRP